MKVCFSLVILLISLLTGCERARFTDENSKAYSLADKSSAYQSLISRGAKSLNDEQLYNRALTLWDTPYRELNVPTSLGSAHIIVAGPDDGKVVVLLHGMNADSTMWYPNINALSKNYRVYAIDNILGAGKTKPNQADDSLESVIAWYFEIFDALKLEKTIIIGASQGGWLATHLALAKPQRFHQLILLSPAQTFTWLEPSFDILSNLLFVLNPDREKLRHILATLSSNVDSINPLYVDHFFRTIKNATISPLLIDMKPFDDEQLRTLNMPVLFLAGDEDLFNSQDSVDRAIKIIPCVQADIIAGSGHFISFDQVDLVNEEMLNFIATKQNTHNEKCNKSRGALKN